MDLELRSATPVEALEIADELEHFAAASMAEFRDDPIPAGCVRRFLQRFDGAPELLVLLAVTPAGERKGVCVTGPLEDPLLGESLATVLILHVDDDLRHRGVARALVREARRVLAERGIHKLAARAAHNDDALISMGERWGFTRLWELMLHE